MLLSHDELLELIKSDPPVITNVKPEMVNTSSIDLTLGHIVLVETPKKDKSQPHRVTLKSRKPIPMRRLDITDSQFMLTPGQFILAMTEQVFNVPNYLSAEYKLKSSMARIGLNHLNAGWVDAGFTGSVLTLELKNMTQNTTIILQPGDFIGQIVFFNHSEINEKDSYTKRGRYNGDLETQGPRKWHQLIPAEPCPGVDDISIDNPTLRSTT